MENCENSMPKCKIFIQDEDGKLIEFEPLNGGESEEIQITFKDYPLREKVIRGIPNQYFALCRLLGIKPKP